MLGHIQIFCCTMPRQSFFSGILVVLQLGAGHLQKKRTLQPRKSRQTGQQQLLFLSPPFYIEKANGILLFSWKTGHFKSFFDYMPRPLH